MGDLPEFRPPCASILNHGKSGALTDLPALFTLNLYGLQNRESDASMGVHRQGAASEQQLAICSECRLLVQQSRQQMHTPAWRLSELGLYSQVHVHMHTLPSSPTERCAPKLSTRAVWCVLGAGCFYLVKESY
jgi:hypothetical protein